MAAGAIRSGGHRWSEAAGMFPFTELAGRAADGPTTPGGLPLPMDLVGDDVRSPASLVSAERSETPHVVSYGPGARSAGRGWRHGFVRCFLPLPGPLPPGENPWTAKAHESCPLTKRCRARASVLEYAWLATDFFVPRASPAGRVQPRLWASSKAAAPPPHQNLAKNEGFMGRENRRVALERPMPARQSRACPLHRGRAVAHRRRRGGRERRSGPARELGRRLEDRRACRIRCDRGRSSLDRREIRQSKQHEGQPDQPGSRRTLRAPRHGAVIAACGAMRPGLRRG